MPATLDEEKQQQTQPPENVTFTPRQAFEAAVIMKASKDPDFRAALMANPRMALSKALGKEIPPSVSVDVLEESPTKLTLILPRNAKAEGELSDEQLEAVAGGGWNWSGF